MKRSYWVLFATMLVLSACSSHRPVYTGREESTEGVPGFVNGKKVAPNIKLGQSYEVDGELYVPRNQPGYVEEGMASWYGPGFHGGKTANGEIFDKNALTAAHRTLPLPSMVRVTLLSTGKQVVVRVNDRGPFAHSRIIDLSRAAAEKIGLLQAGVGKVRVEYMKKESERFAELLATGRSPQSIDVASEVLSYTAQRTEVARADVRVPEPKPQPQAKSAWDYVNPISSAQAAEPAAELEEGYEMNSEEDEEEVAGAAPVSGVTSAELPGSAAEVKGEASPFNVMMTTSESTQMASLQPAAPAPAAPVAKAPVPVDAYYVQLGAFLKMENATRAQQQFTSIDRVEVVKRPNSKGTMLYHVRMGPYASEAEGKLALQRVAKSGGRDARVVRE